MINVLAITNYRSLRDLVVPLGRLNVITGANGSGKSNLYRALRLLSDTSRGQATAAIAREGGLNSVLWAGPENISRAMLRSEQPVQGGPRKEVVRMQLGFASEDFGYAIDFGLPKAGISAFSHDPEVKSETIWHGPFWRPASMLVTRRGATVAAASDGPEGAISLARGLSPHDCMLGELADPVRAPEVLRVREFVRGWRFYDHFRTDPQAPARQPQIGTRTPVLAADGADLAAAIQTIIEVGDHDALHDTVDDAFPGARVGVTNHDGLFRIAVEQPGLLRTLGAAELSDGTLRYLLLVAALLSPRPPPMMVLNEPETSLHPDLLPALGRLIARAAQTTQVWVVSHASRLVASLEAEDGCESITFEKTLGQTEVLGRGMLDAPPWYWPGR
jgi:predicted ATPase